MNSKGKVPTICPFCGLGDGLYLTKDEDEYIGVDFMLEHPSEGTLCTRGNLCFEMIQREDRLINPMIKQNGNFKSVSWSEALSFVAEKLREVINQKGPQATGVFSSAKITNEEAYVLQKFSRNVLKTRNIDNPVRLCHAPTLNVLCTSLGFPYATNKLQSLEQSDCIMIVGANLWEQCPTIAKRILRSKDNSGKIIVIDPRRTKTSFHSEIHLMINPGTDVFLLLSFINCIINSGIYNKKFIKSRVKGFEGLVRLSVHYPPEKIENIVGVPSRKIREVAFTFALSKKGSIIYSHGITQHSFSTEAVKMIVCLAVITGQIGRPGTGLYPMMDQNNMIGVCDTGNLPNFTSGYKKQKEDGMSLLEMIEAADKGEISTIYIDGVNPVVSFPNTQMVMKALSSLDMLVVQEIFMTETAKMADVILPSACWAEVDGTFTNIEGRVQKVNKIAKPLGDSMEGWKIVCELAKLMGKKRLFNYRTWDSIFNEIVVKVPQYSNLSIEKISRIGGAFIPIEKRSLYRESFGTTDGKAHLNIPEKISMPSTSREYPFILITGKAPYHHGSGSVTRKISFPKEEVKEAYIEISPEDARQLGVKDSDLIKISSSLSDSSARAKLAKIKKGALFMPFQFPDQSPNNLIPIILDLESKGAELKSIPVSIEKEDVKYEQK